jgi:CxxC-x17-CxxC domain-containing protein
MQPRLPFLQLSRKHDLLSSSDPLFNYLSMPDFKKNNNRFGGPSRPSFNRPNGGGYGGNRDSRGGSRDFAQKEMFDAECSKCHGVAQVPFRPNGKKPVFCAKCFTQDGERSSDRGFDRGSEGNGGYAHPAKRDFGSARPARFDAPSGPSTSDRQLSELKSQVERMNATIEKLVTVVETFNRSNALTKEIRKHTPADKPAPAPAKVAKEVVKPVAKKVAAKKPVKAAKTLKKSK